MSLALCGCLGPERRIVATVRDPGAVSLHVVSRDGVNKEVLAGDGRPGSATAASGTFPTGGSSSASYELDADRLPDHTIRLRWVHPPIVGGEIDTVLPPSGRIRLLGTDDVASTIRLDAPTLRVPYTAFITPSTDSDGGFNGYAASASAPQAVPASASVAVATTLETPWSNVVEVRRRVKPRRSAALGVLVLSTLFWGVFGGTYVAAAPAFGAGSSGETAFRVVGWSSIAVGGIIDLALLPALFAPDVNEVVYPTR